MQKGQGRQCQAEEVWWNEVLLTRQGRRWDVSVTQLYSRPCLFVPLLELYKVVTQLRLGFPLGFPLHSLGFPLHSPT
jgi:hypothetical protein